jgi:hypothetical protein
MNLMLLADDTAGTEILGMGMIALLVIAALVCLALWVATLFSILGSSYGGGMKVLLVIVCFCFPVLGPLAWFLVVKGNQPGYMYRR